MPPGSARLAGQFAKFVAVGAGNTAISFLAYTGLVAVGVPYVAAGAAGFAAGAVNGYVLNRRWTFHGDDSTRARLRYLAVQAAGLGATSSLLALLVEAGGLDRLEAYAITVPLVTAAMFLANRSWTFGRGALPHPHPQH